MTRPGVHGHESQQEPAISAAVLMTSRNDLTLLLLGARSEGGTADG